MKDLTFYYSTMKGGKTLKIMQLAYNLEENGQHILLIKPSCDTKGEKNITSRIGKDREVDILLDKEDKLLSEKLLDNILFCQHILVDEAQFLTPPQIDELWKITKKLDVAVTCYGLKGNYQGYLFAGTKRLIELADHVIELSSNPLCSCGQEAKFNARKENGEFTTEGKEIEIDGENNSVEYIPLCGKCFFEKVVYQKKRR